MAWRDDMDLPTPCRCGHSRVYPPEEPCTELGLRNHYHFPPFRNLPWLDQMDETYLSTNHPSGLCWPFRHWAFVGEVTRNCSDLRPRYIVRTHYGEDVLVNYYLDSNEVPAFSFDDVRLGCTLCIMYAEKKVFLDLSTGIREDDTKSTIVFPTSLDKVSDEGELLKLASESATRVCFGCRGGDAVKRCAKCHEAWYCSKDCQANHWKSSHRKLCPHTQKLRWLVCINFASFNGFLGRGDDAPYNHGA